MSMTNATPTTCWTADWVRRITGGKWSGAEPKPDTTLRGISIDSRVIKPGQVFLAVKGENFDGHDYVQAALKAGAAFAIIDHQDAAMGIDAPGILLVDNTIEALQRLAGDYRQHLKLAGCKVIAVAGSNGKTATRHLIHTVLASQLQGTQSPKSFNNHLGVPLTLLGASLDDDFLVAEIGTNHPGEIDNLGKILRPDAAVITCIGHEHMEFFRDLNGVANEEAAITRYLPDDAPLFIEKDAYEWARSAESYNASVRPVPYQPDIIRDTLARRLRLSDTLSIILPLLASHDLANATAAIGVGRWMGVDDQHIKTALENVSPMPGRLVVKHVGPVTVIDDTYNANPDSVRAALEVLEEYPAPSDAQRVAVLGDMLELGAVSRRSHEEVGRLLLALYQKGKLHRVVLLGPLMVAAQDTIRQSNADLPTSHYPQVNDQTRQTIADSISPGELVLCKASRSLTLERLVSMIQQRYE